MIDRILDNDQELANCPFCGAGGDDVVVATSEDGYAFVYCTDCGCQGPSYFDDEIDDAVRAWNNRN